MKITSVTPLVVGVDLFTGTHVARKIKMIAVSPIFVGEEKF